MAGVLQSTGYMTNPKVIAAYGNLLDAANQQATKGFQPYDQAAYKQFSQYTPNLVAAQNPYQVNAAQGIAGLQGFIGNQITPQALQYAQQSAAPMQFQGVGQAQIDQYMSPYLRNVAQSAMANINETNAQQQQQLTGNAIAKGAYGGDRAGIAQAQLARQQGLANNATIANLYNTGYGTALGEANVQQNAYMENQLKNRQLANAAGALYQNIGNQSQQAQLGQLQAQYNAGAAKQAQDQAQMSAAYQQFLNYNQQPYNQINWYANAINGAPAAMGGQTVATIPQPSTLSQVGGLAATIAGTNFGNFGQGAGNQKRGGAIRPRAAGGRTGYAQAGAIPAPSIFSAARDYNLAAQRSDTPFATLNQLYNRYQEAKNPEPGMYVPEYGPLNTAGIFSQAQADAVKNASGVMDPNSLPGANPPKATAIEKAAVGVGLLSALGKLFGGGKGGGEGKGSGSTFNSPFKKMTEEQQDALNEKAEIVAGDLILLQDDRNRGRISEADYQAKKETLEQQFASLAKQGAVTEKRDAGESIADAAAVVRQERALEKQGVAPAAGTAPTGGDDPGVIRSGPYDPNAPKMNFEQYGEKKVTDAGGLAPIVYAGAGEFPASRIDPSLAVEFAKNNGLINASPEELQAAGLAPEAVQAVLSYQMSPQTVKALDESEMAMQPFYSQTPEAISTDPAVNAQYQQYINLGFTPEEAQIAATTNTPASGKFGSQATQDQQPESQSVNNVQPQNLSRLPTQPTSFAPVDSSPSSMSDAFAAAKEKQLEEIASQKSNALAAAPDKYIPMTDAQKYVAGVENGTINPAVGAYGFKGYGGIAGQNQEVNQAYAQMVGWATSGNQRMSGYQDYMSTRANPNYASYEESMADYMKGLEEQEKKVQEAELPDGTSNRSPDYSNYSSNDITKMPLIESQGQWLQDMPDIEDLNVSNLTPYQDLSPYQDMGYGNQFGPQDYNAYQDYNSYEAPASYNQDAYQEYPTITPTLQDYGYNYNFNDYDWDFKRGGAVHRPHRLSGGPTAPRFGVAPIVMNYGLPTQADQTNLAESNAGAGVMPVAAGQQALAAQDFFRSKNG